METSSTNWWKMALYGAAAVAAMVTVGWFAGAGEENNNDAPPAKSRGGASAGRRGGRGGPVRKSAPARTHSHHNNDELDEDYENEDAYPPGIPPEAMKSLSPKELLLLEGAQYIQSKNFDKAEEKLTKLIPLLDSHGEDLEMKITILYKLALLSQQQKQLTKAEDYLQRAIAEAEESKQSPKESMHLLVGLTRVVLESLDPQHLATAEEKLSNGLHTAETNVSMENRKVAVLLTECLAKIKIKLGKLDEAEDLAKSFAKECWTDFAEDPIIVNYGLERTDPRARALYMMREIHLKQDKDVLATFSLLLSELEKVLGPEDPKLVTFLLASGTQLLQQAKWEEASTYYNRAFNLLPPAEPITPDWFSCVVGLMCIARELGNTEEAEKHLQTILDNKADIASKDIGSAKSVSKFFKTAECALQFQDECNYKLELEVKKDRGLPTDFVLVTKFEDPSDPTKVIETETKHTIPADLAASQDHTITITSPAINQAKKGVTQIKVEVFSDDTKSESLGTHLQFCVVPMDIDPSRDPTEALYDRLSQQLKLKVGPQ